MLETEVAGGGAEADPELLKLFVEEAREELARIATYFPVWEQNPLEVPALLNVRRSMHTLRAAAAWSARATCPNSRGPARTC